MVFPEADNRKWTIMALFESVDLQYSVARHALELLISLYFSLLFGKWDMAEPYSARQPQPDEDHGKAESA